MVVGPNAEDAVVQGGPETTGVPEYIGVLEQIGSRFVLCVEIQAYTVGTE